MYISTLII